MNPFQVGDLVIIEQGNFAGTEGHVVSRSLLPVGGGKSVDCIDVDSGVSPPGTVLFVNPGHVSLHPRALRYIPTSFSFTLRGLRSRSRVTCSTSFPDLPRDLLGESGFILRPMGIMEFGVTEPYFLVKYDFGQYLWMRPSDLSLAAQALSPSIQAPGGGSDALGVDLSSGATCSSCGDYNQYVSSPYTCYGCRSVSGRI